MRSGEKFSHVRRSFRHPAGSSWSALEKKRNRHLKDLGYFLQAASTDAVHSFLIFLDLLERNPERVTERFLAYRDHHSAHPNAAADMPVDSTIDILSHLPVFECNIALARFATVQTWPGPKQR